MADHSLTLGSLLLTESLPDDDHDFVFNILASGLSFGVAEGVREIITSLLADGDLVRTTRFGNRQVTFAVEIGGPDLASLARGEVALRREIGRGNTLTWEAPMFAAPTVFEVIDSSMSQTFNDLDDLAKCRTFEVTLTCAPFARSQTPVTIAALAAPGSASTVTVDTCDSTTGWEAFVNGSSAGPPDPAWLGTSGGLWAYELFDALPQTLALTRTGSFSIATTPFIVVIAQVQVDSSVTTASAVVDGAPQALTLLSQRKIPTSGQYEYVFQATGSTVTSLTLSNYTDITTAAAFGVFDVKRTNMPPGETPRELTRIIETGGTERTPASLHVTAANGTSPLGGLAIVHTCPEDGSGYSPPLRRWRTADSTGPETASSGALSGKYEPIVTAAGGFYAEVPTSALPEGAYVLMARMAMAKVEGGTATIFWSTSTIFPDSTTQQGYTNGSVDFTFPNDGYTLVPLAVLSLPSVRTAAGHVQVVIQIPSNPVQVNLDEAWLFRADDDCALSIVKTSQPHLWLDSPDASSPVPRVWIGDGASTRVHPGEGLQAMGNHVLSPDGTAVFTAALTDYPQTTATFYRRWHSNAAE